jgi:hypothetical protein
MKHFLIILKDIDYMAHPKHAERSIDRKKKHKANQEQYVPLHRFVLVDSSDVHCGRGVA